MSGESEESLTAWLTGRTVEELAALLRRRPDVLRPPQPRHLSELVGRLRRSASVEAALTLLPLTCVEVAEVMAAFGGGPVSYRALAAFVGADGPQREVLDEALSVLADHALAWPDEEAWRLDPVLAGSWPEPLGLGSPLRDLLREYSANELRRVARTLGLTPRQRKDQLLDDVTAYLSDPVTVRALVRAAPKATQSVLDRWAQRQAGPSLGVIVRSLVPNVPEEQWALDRGLLTSRMWNGAQMPREVALALRGPDYRARLTPHPAEPRLVAVPPERVSAEAAAAVTAFTDQVAAVLEVCAEQSVKCLRSGGVGVRELTRLAKASGQPEDVVRLGLELAAEVGLAAVQASALLVTSGYDSWRGQEPENRFLDLLRAWWDLGATPTTVRAEDGRPLPALLGREPCFLCRNARQAMLAAVARIPPGAAVAEVGEVGEVALWDRPMLHLPAEEEGRPFAACWREAELLGVVALGAATELARALVAGDEEELRMAVRRLLPPAQDTARFGADLTAVVTGTVTAELGALLDLVADRESRGTASVWRFTPSSVRRALDRGLVATALERDLGNAAGGELPQPLRYLISDVSRRHGQLRVSPVGCCVTAQDETLLAEVAANRRFAALRPRLLAPTVCVSALPVADTLALLRAEGYAPVEQDAAGALVLQRPARPRAEASRRRGAVSFPSGRAGLAATGPDSALVAKRLLAASELGGVPADPGELTDSESTLSVHAAQLDPVEVRWLAHAVDGGEPVRIHYVSASGALTRRVVSSLQLEPPYLSGWCHLREDERVFALSRIQAAEPVSR